MSLPLITINPNDSPSKAVDMMFQHYIGHLLVVDNKMEIKEPIGIVTPRDLTRYWEFTRDDDTKMILKRY